MQNQNQIILHVCIMCGIVQDLSHMQAPKTCMVCNSPELEEDVFYIDEESGEIF